MDEVYIQSPLGITKIVGDAKGITEISVGFESSVSKEVPQTLQKAVQQLEEYFSRNRNTFSIKLNPKGTEFQQKVWQELLQIPYGKTTSYLELSKKLGDVKAIRAVAGGEW